MKETYHHAIRIYKYFFEGVYKLTANYVAWIYFMICTFIKSEHTFSNQCKILHTYWFLYVYACVSVHACTGMWRQEMDPCFLLQLFLSCVWKRVSHWTWGSLIYLDRLVKETHESFCLCLLWAQSTSMHWYGPVLLQEQGIKLRCLCLYDKRYTNLYTSMVCNKYWFSTCPECYYLYLQPQTWYLIKIWI